MPGLDLGGASPTTADQPSGSATARIGPLHRPRAARARAQARPATRKPSRCWTATWRAARCSSAFERNHRIGRFPVIDGAVPAPAGYLKHAADDARRMKSNKGFEARHGAAGRAAQGLVLAIAERFWTARGNHTGWIWVSRRAAARSQLQRHRRFRHNRRPRRLATAASWCSSAAFAGRRASRCACGTCRRREIAPGARSRAKR